MIEKMEFLSITGPRDDIDRVVDTYLSKYDCHLENALSELTVAENIYPYVEVNPYRESLSNAHNFCQGIELSDKKHESIKKMPLQKALDIIDETKVKSDEIALERKQLQDSNHEIEEAIRVIKPFRNMEFKISKILKFDFIRFRFGRIEKQYFANFKKYIYDDLNTVFIKCDEDETYVWGVYFVPVHEADEIHAVYSSMHFEKIFIPDQYHGTAHEAYDKLEKRRKELKKAISDNKKAWNKYLDENKEALLSARETVAELSRNFDVRKAAACTNGKDLKFYIICVWMAKKDVKKFIDDIKDDKNLFVIQEEKDRHISHKPPTKLNNPKILKPFELYVRMYGLPTYGEMDPTWFIALTYSFTFGAMFGDVGQGLCLFLIGLVIYLTKKIDLAGIVSFAGIFSTFFGFMYGSVFGFEDVIHPILVSPMESMTDVPLLGRLNTIFIMSIAFGMAIIIICMIFNIINAIKNKDLYNALIDTNAISGLVFYGSAAVILVLFMLGKPIPGTIVLILLFVLPLVLLFLKKPIERFCKKQNKFLPEGVIMYSVEGFFEIFEVILSYFSNTLSFVRVGAFALSHVAMMQVVLMLAGAEQGNINWIIIVIGNIFVCLMEGFGVGIQVLRLEYYEIFSRFYKGSGRKFESFRQKIER